jgi:hypothetical protein
MRSNYERDLSDLLFVAGMAVFGLAFMVQLGLAAIELLLPL